MKKIVLASAFILMMGCSKDKECNCTKQKFKRNAIYTLGREVNGVWVPSKFVSATPWTKTGKEEPAGTDNCDDNGKIWKGSSEDAFLERPDKQRIIETQYQVSCK